MFYTEIEVPTSVRVEHTVIYNMGCIGDAATKLQKAFTSELEGLSCVSSGLCTVTKIDIVGNGCPVHVPTVDEVRTQIVVDITLPENNSSHAVNGEIVHV